MKKTIALLLSVLLLAGSLTSCYLGGVHPDTFYSGVNYSTKTGKLLALTDVIADLGGLEAVLLEKLPAYGLEYYSDFTGDSMELFFGLTLNPGEPLRFLRTDGASYVDMEVIGTLNRVRLNVDKSEEVWPGTVGGISADELFEDMMFGG